MKRTLGLIFFTLILAACDTFGYQPQPFPVWSPIPTRTPQIVTATPVILPLPFTETASMTLPAETATPSATPPPASSTPALTDTPALHQAIQVEILGCNTSLDITHGMGEVTNAFVRIKNTGETDLEKMCVLLRAPDEGREHPDKKACLPSLPARSQVALKLTVDSAYRQDTAVQVDASSNDQLLLRVDRLSCSDIALFGGEPEDMGVVKPINP